MHNFVGMQMLNGLANLEYITLNLDFMERFSPFLQFVHCLVCA